MKQLQQQIENLENQLFNLMMKDLWTNDDSLEYDRLNKEKKVKEEELKLLLA